MTTWVTEYSGMAYVGGLQRGGIPMWPAVGTQAMSSTTTITLGNATRLIRLELDAGAYVLNSSTGVAASSTSGERLAGGREYLRGVSPGTKLTMLST